MCCEQIVPSGLVDGSQILAKSLPKFLLHARVGDRAIPIGPYLNDSTQGSKPIGFSAVTTRWRPCMLNSESTGSFQAKRGKATDQAEAECNQHRYQCRFVRNRQHTSISIIVYRGNLDRCQLSTLGRLRISLPLGSVSCIRNSGP